MRRAGLLAFLLFFSTLAGAQGSAAGYGQGGGGFGGGGMGGAGGGRFGDASEVSQTHPEDDGGEDGRLYETRTAILTPGDRVEYKLKVEKGTTLFAGATSEAFDPALSVEDASGKVLIKNDDREEGDQAPFVAVRFPEAGTYTLKVQSYKQAAGGKFTLKLRTFAAEEAPLGRSIHEHSGEENEARRIVLRIRGKKGTVYDLRQAAVGYSNLPSLVRIVGPSGVERMDYERVSTSDGGPVFQARTDGDYYAEYRTYGTSRFATDLREVPVVAMGVDDEKAVDLAGGDLVVMEFPVEPRQIVRTAVIGAAVQDQMTAPVGGTPIGGSGDPAYGYNPSWTWFRLDRDSNRDVVRIFRTSGTARVALRSYARTPQRVGIRNSTLLPEWSEGEAIRGRLEIGEIRLLRLSATKSELMRVSATSATFQPKLDIFRLDGTLANSLVDRTRHVAADDLYFPKADTFLVRLSCDGYGGSGEFTLKRETPNPVVYKLGTTVSAALDGTNFGLYSVDLEAGKRYQLTLDRPDLPLRTDLLDEDGTFLSAQGIGFEKVTVLYFVPVRSGRHRLWLRGGPGERRFKLDVNVPPALGGGP